MREVDVKLLIAIIDLRQVEILQTTLCELAAWMGSVSWSATITRA